ncbi:hypothetical protein GCM10010168_53340 [Actinoplanes ianthinogenes]|uniref:Scaffolding protein n=1 Tax=Actinoplanes ianthinogenes TaxID=122358 RepID=A0ABM7LQY6_9ACTN|nr:hypothetical protein [Actinoplanes ianthinogenes]BCJ41668.1 hypothetical protein Aiant_23250 [Actinoplanes ianthinogenes]GGR28540.1 hypothetical protein GCM10010168_53340 [Actinoplanes ianthinogenes]
MSDNPTTAPSTEPANDGGTTGDAPSTTPPSSGQAPQWEGDFDPERAARLVENLRRDLAEARAKAKTPASEVAELKSQLDAIKGELTQSRLDAAKADAVATARIPAHLAAYVTGSTPDEIKASAEKVAADFGVSAEPDPIPGRPRPRLTPGHTTGDSAHSFDPAAVARAARGH